MKFHQLPIGSQFEFQQTHYTKETPLVARDTVSGKKKFIARSADVVTTETTPKTDTPTRKTLQKDEVLLAFDAFCNRCLDNLGQLPLEQHERDNVCADMEKAKQQFLHRLSLTAAR